MPEVDNQTTRLSRRRFLRLGCWGVASGALMCGLGTAYGLTVEPGWIELVQTEVRLPGWPAALDGFTIAQLSDLHHGPEVDLAHIRQGVEMVNAARPDLVVLTGDYVTGSAAYCASCARELAALHAPYGVYAVLGNHDIWTDTELVAGNLIDQGIALLRDAHTSLEISRSRLWLLGIEDNGYMGSFDFARFQVAWQEQRETLAGLVTELPAGEPRLLLAHNPDFTEMLPAGRIDLALCGHTHGGQVQLPLAGAPIVPSCFGQKYVEGLVQGPQTMVYVNRGLGLISPAVRVGCRPEVSLLRLRPSA